MSVSSFRLLERVLLGVLGVSLTVPPAGLGNVRIEGGEVPYYARISRDLIFYTDEWAVIVFYLPPGCVPDDFDLLDFFDFPDGQSPGAFGCAPVTIDGFTIWKNGPFVDAAPIQAEFHEVDALPVWFVAWSELQGAIADGELTIIELAGMDSLLIGSADFYQETLHPSEGAHVGKIEYVAQGVLEDGRSFEAQISENDGGRSVTRVRITFGGERP